MGALRFLDSDKKIKWFRFQFFLWIQILHPRIKWIQIPRGRVISQQLGAQNLSSDQWTGHMDGSFMIIALQDTLPVEVLPTTDGQLIKPSIKSIRMTATGDVFSSHLPCMYLVVVWFLCNYLGIIRFTRIISMITWRWSCSTDSINISKAASVFRDDLIRSCQERGIGIDPTKSCQ